MFKISIVITAYKRPAELVEAVRSCIEQTYPPFEIIIGDDSPDDLGVKAIEPLLASTKLTIRYLHNQPSLGQANNTNMLFNEAKGDKTVLLHGDDLLLPDSLETLVSVFQDHPEVDIAFGKQYIIDDDGVISPSSSLSYNVDYFREKEFEGAKLTPFEAGLGQQLPNNGFMINTSIVKSIKWRNDLGNGGEFEYGFRLGEKGYKMFYVDKFLGMYRVSKSSMMYTKTEDSALQAYLILSQAKPDTALGEKIRKQRLYERAPIAITQAIYNKRKREALSILFSKWYRNRILTPRGIKRLFLLVIHF